MMAEPCSSFPVCVSMHTRCEGVEHFLLSILKDLPDMDIMINVYDHPQVGPA